MSAASGLCGVCSQWREWGQGAEFEVVVPGQSPPATGPCRFGRQLHPPVLALGLQNGPERRASLGWNERKFLSLMFYFLGTAVLGIDPAVFPTWAEAGLN